MKDSIKKTVLKLVSLMMVLALMFSVMAVAEENEDPVLATVNGKEITQSEAEYYLYILYYYGYIDDWSDYYAALDYIIKVNLLDEALRAEGYYEFTEDELASMRAEAEEEKQAAIEEYVSYYLTEDTEEARAELLVAAEAYYADYENEILDELMYEAAYQRWSENLPKAEITDESLKELYAEYVAEDQELFDGNVYNYECYLYYYGYYSFYIPEGYRSVRRIVFAVDGTLLQTWYDAKIAFEDGAEGEDADALKNALIEVETAVLASVQDKITEAQTALQSGEDFASVCDRLTEDDAYVSGGNNQIKIHEDSVLYDPYFVEGVFADEIVEKGSVIGPFVTQEGVLIVLYEGDVAGGPIELTDELMQELREEAEQDTSAAEENKLQEYMDNAVIVYNEEAIAAAIAELASAE